MKFPVTYYRLFIFILLGTGCGPKKVSMAEFAQQVAADKAYKREQQAGDYYVTTRYLPPQLMALTELYKGNTGYTYNKATFEEEVKRFSNGLYFEVTFGLKNGTNIILKNVDDQSAYAARIGAITYKLNDDFYVLTENNEKIKPLQCTFSNTYGNSPEAKVIFVFPKEAIEKSSDKIHFTYNDHCFGIPQQLEFEYETAALNKSLPVIVND